jgi:undecaprenyl-diphosphatase
VLAMGITYIIKYSLHIPRPFLSGVTPLFVHGGYNSFPSGHATFFASLALAMFFYHKKRGWWFLISAIAIGLARIIAGVHYPIDVAVGYIIGIASSYFIIKIFRPWFKKKFLGIE